MRRFEVVSLDMFQTLVDVNSRVEQIWRPILSDTYTAHKAEECARLLLHYFFKHWPEQKSNPPFFLIKEVYERSFESVFRDMNMIYEAHEANKILFEEHTHSACYEDTEPFLNRISPLYQVCIVSDADEAMIPRFHEAYGIPIFISEHYQSYKNDADNAMFKQLLDRYQVDPSKVIHIGDSVADVVGAKREGITACWLNRNKRSWDHKVAPDLVIQSLEELEGIL
ncbi:MAG: HAD family hydrolase [Paenibacillus sp.]|nr:HAD family hydrolase [Paenibacillus sp.]